MDTNSQRKLLFGTIRFIPKPQPRDSILIECIDVEDEESEPHKAPVEDLPPLCIVNNVMCIDLIDSEEESSKSGTEEGTITPVRMKGEAESLSNCEAFSVIIGDSPTIDKSIIVSENASPAMQPLVIEVSDSKEVSEEEEESNCNRGISEPYEPMNLLQPMFDVEDRSELEAIGFKCKYCQRILMKKDDLKKEYQMHVKERRALRNKKIICSRCKKTFSSRIEFEWHEVECVAKIQAAKRRVTRQSVKKCKRKTK